MHYFLKLQDVQTSATRVARIDHDMNWLSKPITTPHFVKNVVPIVVMDQPSEPTPLTLSLTDFAVFESDGKAVTIPNDELESLKKV